MSESLSTTIDDTRAPARPNIGWRVVGLVVSLGLLALIGPAFVRSLRPSAGEIVDFYKEWSSVRNHFTGRPVYASQRATIEEYLQTPLAPGHEFTFIEEYNTHPPTSVLVALPFGYLAYADAQLAWNLLGIALFALSLWLIARELRIAVSPWAVAIFAGLLMVCDPFRQTIIQGQINFVLLLLVTLAWIGDRRGWSWCAGMCLALATCLKLFPGLFFVMFAVRRDWKTLAWGIAGGAGITALTAAVLGPQAYLDWLDKPLAALRPYTNEWGNSSILAFWQRLFGPAREDVVPIVDAEHIATLLTALSAVVVVAVLGRMAWRADSRDARDFAFAATATAMLLLTPIAWQHYYIILALPLLLLAARLEPGSPSRWLFFAALAVLWLPTRLAWLSAGLTTTRSSALAYPHQSLTALSAQFYAVLAVFVLLAVARAWNAGSQSSSLQRAS